MFNRTNGNLHNTFLSVGDLLHVNVGLFALLPLPCLVDTTVGVNADSLFATFIDARMLVSAQMHFPPEYFWNNLFVLLLLFLSILDIYDLDLFVVVMVVGSTRLFAKDANKHTPLVVVAGV